MLSMRARRAERPEAGAGGAAKGGRVDEGADDVTAGDSSMGMRPVGERIWKKWVIYEFLFAYGDRGGVWDI